jgi:recombination protein U
MGQGKRGQILEEMITLTNKAYSASGRGQIDKIPTPWNVSFDKKTRRVLSAFPQEKSTVDFIGVSRGLAIAFDAKETIINSSFPMANIEQHQVDYLLKFQKQGGMAFLIISFAKRDERYFLPIGDLMPWWNGQAKGGRKSIPYEWFSINSVIIPANNGVFVDYLTIAHSSISRR